MSCMHDNVELNTYKRTTRLSLSRFVYWPVSIDDSIWISIDTLFEMSTYYSIWISTLGSKSVTIESMSESPRKIFLAIKISYNFYWKGYTTTSWYILSKTRSRHCWGQKRLSRNKHPNIVFLYEIFLDTLSTKVPEQKTREKLWNQNSHCRFPLN